MTSQNSALVPVVNIPPDPTGPVYRPRHFYYDGQLFEDPGPEYSPQDILNFLAATYPELRNGTWTQRTLPDGSEEITFHKVTGEKGAAVTVAQLLQALDTVQPRRIAAFALTQQITTLVATEQLTPETMLAMGPEIEAALKEAERLSTSGGRITGQILAIPASPHNRVPLGF
jgi:PRTRC genetic system protein C